MGILLTLGLALQPRAVGLQQGPIFRLENIDERTQALFFATVAGVYELLNSYSRDWRRGDRISAGRLVHHAHGFDVEAVRFHRAKQLLDIPLRLPLIN